MVQGPLPLLTPDSLNWVDIFTDGAIHLIGERGMSGLTVRALAAWLRVTPAAVSHRMSREELVIAVVGRFARRWVRWIETRVHEHGLLALLPTDDDGVPGLRVWLAFTELGRDNERVARCVSEVRATELLHVGRLTRLDDDDLDDDDLPRLMALIDGLRLAVCAPVGAMPVERALALLADDPAVRQ